MEQKVVIKLFKMIIIKTLSEIEKLFYSNQIVANVLKVLIKNAKPGVTTAFLNKLAETLLESIDGAKPAFKGYRGFPYSLCASVNEQVVHGFPSDTLLKNGDLLSMDFGVVFDGYYGDSAVTVYIGEKPNRQIKKLLRVTKKALYRGISKAVPGNTISDISRAIQKTAEDEGFNVVRAFGGHGIGRDLHEDPFIPNYVDSVLSNDYLIKVGMAIAIEPMLTIGSHEVIVQDDGWIVVTVDRKLSAHFEHTVAVTKDGPKILSAR
jgi:methionyl aminopeptidase